MKNKSLQILLIVYCLITLLTSKNLIAQSPSIAWQKTIGGDNYDELKITKRTADGGFISGGISKSGNTGIKGSQNMGEEDYWIVKQYPNGVINWEISFGGIDIDMLKSIQQTSDGGFIVGGQSTSGISRDKTELSYGNSDFWVLKLDPAGHIIWQKDFGGTNEDLFTSIQPTSDGGYIVCGYSNSDSSGIKTQNSNGDYDYWILKLNATGDLVWQKTIGGAGFEMLTSLQQTEDGGYLIGGNSNSSVSGDKTQFSFGGQDIWVLKLDGTGNIIWQKSFGGNSTDGLSAIQQITDSTFILGGYSNSPISGNKLEAAKGMEDFWLIKINSIGEIAWQKTIGGANADVIADVKKTLDNGFVLGGYSNSDISGDKTEASFGEMDYWIIKVDSIGDMEWQKTVGGNDYDIISAIELDNDGGVILGGTSRSYISGLKSEDSYGSMDFWVLKLGTTCPTNLVFHSQSDIDNFPVSFPICNRIYGNVEISGANITNLTPLKQITTIKGDLIILNNPNLQNLTGLDSLKDIGGLLQITNNDLLSSLIGLDKLTAVGGLELQFDTSLLSLTHLNQLTTVKNDLNIFRLHQIHDLSGLNNLHTIGGKLNLTSNLLLDSLTGLNNLTSIGKSLTVNRNSNQINFSGLNNLEFLGGNLELIYCPRMIDFTGLQGLTTIPGSLIITEAYNLISLTGLNNVTVIGNGIDMYNGNQTLTSLEGLNSLQTVIGNLSISGYYQIADITALRHLTSVNGKLILSQMKTNSLAGLDSLKTVGGIYLYGFENIKDLAGLGALVSLNGDLEIAVNPHLKSFDGLGNFGSIINGHLLIFDNDSLTNIAALSNVTSINGYVEIKYNHSLPTLTGLNAIQVVGDVKITNNDTLSGLVGLNTLNIIGGSLDISNNKSLINILSLNHIVNIDSNLTIQNNSLLGQCSVAAICNFINQPNGIKTISNNAVGCSSVSEVQQACNTVLAFSLKNFTGICINGKIQLSWETTQPNNNQHFVIEKSTDAIHWSDIATLYSANFPVRNNKYSYIDTKSVSAKTYYKVKMVDLDGIAVVSNVINIKNCNELEHRINIYPNPTTDGVFVNSTVIEYYEIYDLSGRLIEKDKLNVSTLFISMKQLAPSLYHLRLIGSDSSVKSFQIIKK